MKEYFFVGAEPSGDIDALMLLQERGGEPLTRRHLIMKIF